MENPGSSRSVFKYRMLIVAIGLPGLGLVLILLAQTFHTDWHKIEWDRLLAEIGALFVVVALLHWLFDWAVREEMLREVAGTVSGSIALRDCGFETCNLNSRDVRETIHWCHCNELIIGRQYSTRFIKDFHDVLTDRSANNRNTRLVVLDPEGKACKYLLDEGPDYETVSASLQETARIVADLNRGKKKPTTRLHFCDRIFRYSFIHTGESIWVILYTNNAGRNIVPAIKVRAGSPLFNFFHKDIEGLMENSREVS